MPDLRALQPNSMLRNDGGKGFQDVTFSGGFGHLQKGHGIAFADVNNDGHVDVSISLGGGVVGDKMFDALFLNPGTFFHNSWLKLSLVGVKSNKLGQGARLKVTTANGRKIYMTQGLTASFGSNPVKIQHIGLGDIGPDGVVDVEIAWPIAGAAPQTVRGVRANSWVTVTEGSSDLRYGHVRAIVLRARRRRRLRRRLRRRGLGLDALRLGHHRAHGLHHGHRCGAGAGQPLHHRVHRLCIISIQGVAASPHRASRSASVVAAQSIAARSIAAL